MSTVDYDKINMGELRVLVKEFNAADLLKRPIATRGRIPKAQMVDEFVLGVEECDANGTLDDVPEKVYDYYCSIMIPDENEGEEEDEDPDVNEGYVRDEDDDLVDEYRASQKGKIPKSKDDEEYEYDDDPVVDDEDDEEDEAEDSDDDIDDEGDIDDDEYEKPASEYETYEEDFIDEEEDEPPPPKRRGRPPKSTASKKSPPKKPGRPSTKTSKSEPPKRRGRPPKTTSEKRESIPPKRTPPRMGKTAAPSPATKTVRKIGKAGPPGRAAVFYKIVQSKEPLTKSQIIDAMLDQGYSLAQNRTDASFWTKEYIDLMVAIGIIEKRGEGKSAKYVYVG